MNQIKLTKKEKAEFERICDFFMEATSLIDDTFLRARVSSKILSRLSGFADRLVDKDDRLMEFEAWLRTVCFQKPTPEAYDLAKSAWEYAIKTACKPR